MRIPVLSIQSATRNAERIKVLTLFGTRPEIIKLAPIIHALERSDEFHAINVSSAQHTDLLYPFIELFRIRLTHDLKVMQPGQTPNLVLSRVLAALEPVLKQERPDVLLVQGDTTTALAGALAGFHHGIPVGHVEAGLRSGNPLSPFPEEMNRRLITRVATFHFAATARNAQTLRDEGVADECVFLTGNPVVDSLLDVLASNKAPATIEPVLKRTNGLKRMILTTHRRESFGEAMSGNLHALRSFVDQHADTALIFPVHPNPAVRSCATAILGGHDRIHLLDPLDYVEFIYLLSKAWLIVSDSGGVQEEAPSLGKPLLILRENTERPEAVESGAAILVGGSSDRLSVLLQEAYAEAPWMRQAQRAVNPFGSGDAGRRIVEILATVSARRE